MKSLFKRGTYKSVDNCYAYWVHPDGKFWQCHSGEHTICAVYLAKKLYGITFQVYDGMVRREATLFERGWMKVHDVGIVVKPDYKPTEAQLTFLKKICKRYEEIDPTYTEEIRERMQDYIKYFGT
jgi:hypothetical protein